MVVEKDRDHVEYKSTHLIVELGSQINARGFLLQNNDWLVLIFIMFTIIKLEHGMAYVMT